MRGRAEARSAGLLLFKGTADALEVFLVHPGGPYWAKKDEGAWSIPKGVRRPDEEPLAAARREFEEETGKAPPRASDEEHLPLDPVRQPGGKWVHAWALRGDLDPDEIRSNTFSMVWPPGSGTVVEFPEVDRAAWFPLETARSKILRGQAPILDQLSRKLRMDVREARPDRL